MKAFIIAILIKSTTILLLPNKFVDMSLRKSKMQFMLETMVNC